MKKIFKSAIAMIAVVVMVMSLFAGCGSATSSPEKAVENILKVGTEGNFDNLESLAPKAYWDTQDEDIKDIIEKAEKAREAEEAILEAAGASMKDFKFSYKVEDSEAIEGEDFDAIVAAITEKYEAIEKDSIEEAAEVKAVTTIKYTGDNETYKYVFGEDGQETKGTFTVVKIDGSWYCWNFILNDFYITSLIHSFT